QDADVAPAAVQQPGGHEPVAAVVALAADDRDRPRRRDLPHESGEAFPGALHELQRRDALLLDRPAVGRAHRVGVEQRIGPVGKGHAMSATAPAIPREWVREIWTSATRS